MINALSFADSLRMSFACIVSQYRVMYHGMSCVVYVVQHYSTVCIVCVMS